MASSPRNSILSSSSSSSADSTLDQFKMAQSNDPKHQDGEHGPSHAFQVNDDNDNSNKVQPDLESQHRPSQLNNEDEKSQAPKPPSNTNDSHNNNIVDFDSPSDPANPQNWALRKKIITTLLYGLTTAGSTWNSSIFSVTTTQVSQEFRVGNIVSTLGLTLFLFGFGTGPLLWAPLSEAYGRKIAVLPPYFISVCFCFGTATAKDIQTIMITRFFSGWFGSAPVTNTGGVLSDIWAPDQRALAILGYSMAVAGAPNLSPLVGAAIVENSALGWRWVFYITGILMAIVLFFDVIFLEESSAPVLLTRKADKMRRETGNWALHSKREEKGMDMHELVHKYLVRPWRLFVTPICFCMVFYASFVYGIIYLYFAAFPYEYITIRHWHPVTASLPFLSVLLGCFMAGVFVTYNQKYYKSQLRANNGRPVPEARLRPMMLGSIVNVIGLFVFAWTSNPHIHWIGTCIGTTLMGFGFFSIFQGSNNYLVDTFQKYGASALAANTILRSLFAGVFPLFTRRMFEVLGVDWAVSLLGFVSLAMVPIPFLFTAYGQKLRAMGEWSRDSTM